MASRATVLLPRELFASFGSSRERRRGSEAANKKRVSGLNSACESSAPGSVSPQSDCAIPQYFCKPVCTHLHAGIWHDFNRQNEKSCVECNPCLRRVRAGIGRMSERPML